LEFRLAEAVTGYLWLELEGDGATYVATAEDPGTMDPIALRREAQPVVTLTGQRRWLDPEPRRIGSVVVFGTGRPAAVEVWPLTEEFSSGAPGVVPGRYGPEPRTRWTTRTPQDEYAPEALDGFTGVLEVVPIQVAPQ